MQNLHNSSIAHKDIKAENILFNPVTNEIKLFDFGCATFNSVSLNRSISKKIDYPMMVYGMKINVLPF